jgi:type VI secretion system protein ImpG
MERLQFMSKQGFERYFQNELIKLRNLSKEFSQEHPSVAPLLSDSGSDPDAQRLLEGVAFLTALLEEKLDSEFPQVAHGLMNILFPHFLKPTPSFSIEEFSPKPSIRETIHIPKDTELKSTPIDDTECIFSTTLSLDISPINIEDLQFIDNTLCAKISLLNTTLKQLKIKDLGFYLGDTYSQSANLFMLFSQNLTKITIELENGITINLPLDSLEQEGFKIENSLFKYPQNAFGGYRVLQEYFLLPQKFLFFKLCKLEKLEKYELDNFTVKFQFDNSNIKLQSVSKESMKLFCSPIVNLFKTEAEPISLNLSKELLHVRPPLRYADTYQIYDIIDITSYIQGQPEKNQYFPFESFKNRDESENIYQIVRKRSIVNSEEEVYIQLHLTQLKETTETLSIRVTCTNGQIPQRLQLGEISQASDSSPELATFKNILPCTMQVDSPIDSDSSWQFISHLGINLLNLSDLKIFKEMLGLYSFSNSIDKTQVVKNQKKISAIEDFEVQIVDRIKRGYLIKGHKVKMTIRKDQFASIGDLYLFCTVLLHFLSSYTTLNTFVELEVKESITGERFTWEPILGNKKLI